MRAAIIALFLLACGARPASAGLICTSATDNDAAMARVEAFAKDPAQAPYATAWLCVQLDATRLAKRIAAACGPILDRDGDTSPCLLVTAAAGVAKLGAHDIVAAVIALPEDPINATSADGWPKTTLLGTLGDPRGAAVIVAEWRDAIPRAAKHEHASSVMVQWSSWRQAAAASLGKLGGADEAAFVREQAKATVDAHVRDACLAAAKAIDARARAH